MPSTPAAFGLSNGQSGAYKRIRGGRPGQIIMTDGDKVAAFPRVALVDQTADHQPVAEVVEAIKGLLAKAESGQLKAIAFAYIRQPERISYGWFGVKHNLTRMHLLHSGMMVAATDYGQEIADSSTDVDPDEPESA
jgi:hypothetical protein